jgi:NAD-dependent SIR2 family protein deacetylase
MCSMSTIWTHKKILLFFLEARCVKCVEAHSTENCPRKSKDSSVKCINCGGEHPANYKGCIVYQSLRKKLYPQLREKKIERTNQGISSIINPNISFADALSGTETTVKNILPQSNDMAELKTMMKDLMKQMSTMLNLLTVVVSKLK